MLLSGVDPGQVVWVGEPPSLLPPSPSLPLPQLKLNPLDPNIYIQIFLTDLHTINLVIDLLILITFSLACVQTLPPPFPSGKIREGEGSGVYTKATFCLDYVLILIFLSC